MAGVIDNVKDLLSGAGYPTGDAGPGLRAPAISEPVIALSLEQVDTDKHLATVRVCVVSPLGLGARSCQDVALEVCRLLQGSGAVCKLEPYELDTKAEVFVQPVMASFYGDVLEEDWQAEEVCRVRFDGVYLQNVTAFTAWRQVDEDTPELEDALWHFRVEEQLNGICEEEEPREPFPVLVDRGGAQEYYSGCRLTYHKRVLSGKEMTQIREGTATARAVRE